jgi:hypothetical protein
MPAAKHPKRLHLREGKSGYKSAVLNGEGQHPRRRPLVAQMTCIFDIFATLPDGTPLWFGSVEGFDEARKRMSRLAQNRPGKYFLYSEESGEVIERSRDEQGPDS